MHQAVSTNKLVLSGIGGVIGLILEKSMASLFMAFDFAIDLPVTGITAAITEEPSSSHR